MKPLFTILFICWSIVCYCQEANTNEESKNEFLNIALSNSLHSDFTDANRPNSGVNCTFRKDGTFCIQAWFYGVNAGHINYPAITGNYEYNSSTKTIELFFDNEQNQTNSFKEEKPVPVSYRAMQTLYCGGQFLCGKQEEDAIDYSGSYIRIMDETKDKMTVDLYAFADGGEKNIMAIGIGQRTFTKKDNKETTKQLIP